MSQDLLTQLRDYGEYQHEMRQRVTVEDLERLVDHRMVPIRPSRPNGPFMGIAALVAVLVLMGGAALLFSGSGGEQPAVTVVTTLVEITPSTVAESGPPTTVASTDPTLAVEPVSPPGEGPQLEFVPVELPDRWLGGGVWFQGALYAISDGGLFRSSDGFTWELLPAPLGIANLQRSGGLETGGGLLVYAGVDEVDENSGCSLPGDAIVVHTSDNGVDWKTSRIDLPIPDSSFAFGCYGADISRAAVGPQGIMIAGVVRGHIQYESIVEAELGLGLDPETGSMEIGGNIMYFETDDGEVYEIDLEAAGYLDGIESFGEEFVGTGYAWFSPDGQTWSQLDASGPLDGGEITAVVATSDGFVATSTSSEPPSPRPPQMFLWETTDGTTWIQKSNLSDSHLSDPSGLAVWDGRLVAASRDGVWTIEDTPQELIASDAMSGLRLIRIGEFGLVAMPKLQDPGERELLFSANGTTWNRWTPPEFGPEFLDIDVVGIGDDFVVLRVDKGTGVSHWVGRLP